MGRAAMFSRPGSVLGQIDLWVVDSLDSGSDTLDVAVHGTSQGVRILGIDPGLRTTGYGVIDYFPSRKSTLVDAGVIRLDGKMPIPSRLVELEREMVSILEEHRPEVVAVELLFSNYAHPRTAILMAHARGVLLLCARRAGARIEQIAPKRVKQSLTGHGATGKSGMQRAIQQYWNLPELPKPADVADALAIALTCGRAMPGASHPSQ